MSCLTRRFPFYPLAIIVAVAVALCGPEAAVGAPFHNLGFESAVIGTPVNFELPASQALPYWTASYGNPGYVLYDTVSTGVPAVSIQDGLTPYGLPLIMEPIQGSYSVFIQAGDDPDGDAWIAQTGDIPGNAQSLMYMTEANFSNLVVSLNGTDIPMSLYSVGAVINSYHGAVETFIGDIRAFSGQQDVTLKFDVSHPGYGDQPATLDGIQFSPTIVPEPSTLALIVIGVLQRPLYFLLGPRALAK